MVQDFDEVHTTVLWRESPWHCACGRVGLRWIAHLYLDDVIVEECTFDVLSPILRMAHSWRAAVTTNPCALIAVSEQQVGHERTVKTHISVDDKRAAGAPPTQVSRACSAD